jgi:ribosomal protein S27E
MYIKIITLVFVIVGILTIVASAIFSSSFLAILGTSCIFWCGVLFFITPDKHVSSVFLNVATVAGTSNIERILTEASVVDQKGVYLPPMCLRDHESSLLFVPKALGQKLPSPEETEVSGLFNSKQNLFFTPPGVALSKIFEKQIGHSFTKVELSKLQKVLLKVVVEDARLAEDILVNILVDKVVFEVKNSVFVDDCQKSQTAFPRAHNTVGCLLSSCFACVLAKVTGRAIVILKEEINADILRIEYQTVEA